MKVTFIKEVKLELMPPELATDCGQEYDVTCEVCYLLEEDCKHLWNLCDEGEIGFFKKIV